MAKFYQGPAPQQAAFDALNTQVDTLNGKCSTNVISSTNLDSLPDAFNMYSWWGGAGNTGLPSNVGSGEGCILVTYPANATYKQLQILSTGNRYYFRQKSYLDVWTSWDQLASNSRISGLRTVLSTTTGSVTVANSTFVTVQTLAITPGTYIITGDIDFGSNSTGTRILLMDTTENGYNSVNNSVAVTGRATLHKTRLLTVNSNTTIYLRAYQASGDNLAVTGLICAVKLAPN